MDAKPVWGKLWDLFERASGMNEAERRAFLDRECAGDAALREGVDALLVAQNERAGRSRLEEARTIDGDSSGAGSQGAAAAGDATPITPVREGPGTSIGKYKILQEIGEGGFGSVYMAEQERPVRRRVALKVIKLGMDTKQVIARFEAERQALALMDHPNIAKVLDAGATERGRPFFVMELVKGVPITEYCDQNNLSTTERLALFVHVCHAVQHAHQKGIIHRDIKPSNVLVTSHDGTPVPKVIDFGVAKATNARLTERTMFTELRQLVGTPEYMSPEQAEMSGLDVDTRSDIYSLGVLLYELLTGTTPFDSHRLRAAGHGEIQRIIREEEPHRPSTRLESTGSEVAAPRQSAIGTGVDRGSSIEEVARHRRTDPTSLSRAMRGDLDWIVMKAMEKDRTRRYETANGLALDIGRHLSDEPVLASPPGAAYRFGKFARRNRAMLTTVGAVAAALIIGLSLATYGFIRASHERDEKELAREAAIDALQQEQAARTESEAVTRFLASMLAAVDPGDQGRDVRVRAVLDEAAARIGAEFGDQPLIEARLRQAIGSSYQSLGLYSKAERHLPAAHEIHRRLLGGEHPATLTSLNSLASLYRDQGRHAEAEPLQLEVLETRRRALGDEHLDTLRSMNDLALLYDDQGRYAESGPLYHEVLDTAKRVLGEDHLETLKARSNLTWLYRNQGRYDEAQPLGIETLAACRRALGNEHPQTLVAMSELATLYEERGRRAEAVPLFEETLRVRRRVLGDEHPGTLTSMHNLAVVYRNEGRYESAERLCAETLEIRRRVLGWEHPHTLVSTNELATLHEEQGRLEAAEPLYVETLRTRRRLHGEEHPGTLTSMNNLAHFYSNQGRYEEAEPLFVQLLEVTRRVIGEDHPNTLATMSNLGDLYTKTGRLDQADRVLSDAFERGDRSLPERNWLRGVLSRKYGVCLMRQERFEEAEAQLLEAHRFFVDLFGTEHMRTERVVGNLVELYESWDKSDAAAKWRRELPAEDGTPDE